MIDITKIDYSRFDRHEILMFLFHPRSEERGPGTGSSVNEILIPVEKDVIVGAKLHIVGKSAPNILFFHGNGEIVADYDDISQFYTGMGINFFPVDYRGYGLSTGEPTVTAMMRDSHIIFNYFLKLIEEKGFTGSLIIMGRSLGSASALELARHYGSRIDGLIIESGFAHFGPLLQLLGIRMRDQKIREISGLKNIEKIRGFNKSTLIIHAERDQVIPVKEGQDLYNACGAGDKTFLMIPGANHNDIFLCGMPEYMKNVKEMVNRAANKK